MKKLVALLLASTLILGLAGVALAETPEEDIVDTAIAAGEFETLVAALTAADLVDALKADGPFTVFAPTDAAFAALPAGTLEKLLDNPDLLAKVLLYHVVEGSVLAADVVGLDGQSVTTLGGQSVAVTVANGSVLIDASQVTATDILCSNGVIHVIDAVLIPEWDIVETAILNEDFNTLVTAVAAAGLVDALKADGPFTVFAPTDAAFAALPEGLLVDLLGDPTALGEILLYHVVSGEVMAADVLGLDGQSVMTLLGKTVRITIQGGNVFINDAQVTVTDIACSNGVIHVLDAVLVPDAAPDPAAPIQEVPAPEPEDLPKTGGAAAHLAWLGAFSIGWGAYLLKRRD